MYTNFLKNEQTATTKLNFIGEINISNNKEFCVHVIYFLTTIYQLKQT